MVKPLVALVAAVSAWQEMALVVTVPNGMVLGDAELSTVALTPVVPQEVAVWPATVKLKVLSMVSDMAEPAVLMNSTVVVSMGLEEQLVLP
jgi:hypothetical protein